MVDYAETIFWVRIRKHSLYHIQSMPSERGLKILSIGTYIRCIRSLGGVGEQF